MKPFETQSVRVLKDVVQQLERTIGCGFRLLSSSGIEPLLSQLLLFQWTSNCYSNDWLITPLMTLLKMEIINSHRGFSDHEPKK
jgi:hypothetical protein